MTKELRQGSSSFTSLIVLQSTGLESCEESITLLLPLKEYLLQYGCELCQSIVGQLIHQMDVESQTWYIDYIFKDMALFSSSQVSWRQKGTGCSQTLNFRKVCLKTMTVPLNYIISRYPVGNIGKGPLVIFLGKGL